MKAMPRLDTAILTSLHLRPCAVGDTEDERERNDDLHRGHCFLTIERVDETALVQTPDDRVVDQLFRLYGFRLWDRSLDVAQYRFDGFFQRIGLARLHVANDHLITILDFILIPQLHELFDQRQAVFLVVFSRRRLPPKNL